VAVSSHGNWGIAMEGACQREQTYLKLEQRERERKKNTISFKGTLTMT
jgi:hypothetical protein